MSPGQRDRADRELAAASTALREAAALLDLGLVIGAVSRLYYAVFHAARAALLVRDRHAKTHTGQMTLFHRTFGAEPLLGALLRKRIDADYRPADFDESEPSVRELLEEATAFVDRCRGLVADEVGRGIDDPDPPPDL